MARTTHDRRLDHRQTDLDTNMVLNGATTTYADATVLHTVIAGLDTRVDTQKTASVTIVLGSGSGVIPTGIAVHAIELPCAGVWTSWRLFADQTGSLVVDIWKDTYANFPPTVADTITASAKPTLSSAAKNENTTLTGWTTAFSAGDILRVNVDSSSTVTLAELSLRFRRT